MKASRFYLALFVGNFICLGNAWAADPPPGFTDPTVLSNVLAGNIDTQVVTNTNLEQHVFLRAQFKKGSPDAYRDVATNYEGFPDILPEVESGTTVDVNSDRTQFDYKLDVVFQEGPFPFHVYPAGHETYTPAADATSEGKFLNVVTNYQDTFKMAQESTRLIPWQDTMLVEDEVHVILVKDGATAGEVKKQLVNEFTRMLTAFRDKLEGNK